MGLHAQKVLMQPPLPSPRYHHAAALPPSRRETGGSATDTGAEGTSPGLPPLPFPLPELAVAVALPLGCRCLCLRRRGHLGDERAAGRRHHPLPSPVTHQSSSLPRTASPLPPGREESALLPNHWRNIIIIIGRNRSSSRSSIST